MSSPPILAPAVPGPRLRRGPGWLALLGLAAFSLAGLAAAAWSGEGVGEYELKAAFLGKFVRYVTWPVERTPSRTVPLRVGVLGADPFGRALDEIFRSRRADEPPAQIVRFPSVAEVRDVHLLFVPRRERAHLAELMEATRGTGLLLVGESPEFAPEGGVIGFYLEGDKLRFEVNLEAARREHLKLSADLLRLARIVGGR